MRNLLIYSCLLFISAACGNSSTKKSTETPDTLQNSLAEEAEASPNSTKNSTENKADKELITDEAEVVPAHSTDKARGLKTLHSLRFKFAIDIPQSWKGIDKSGNGDGFIIEIPDSKAEVSVYGEEISSDLLSIYKDLCDESLDYTFANGSNGSLCKSGNEATYSQIAKDVMISIDIKDQTAVEPKYREQLDQVVKSLRFYYGETEEIES
ncbi:hypothetical protein GC194_01540 [bacterium]|nr:hypothetical protein [bacterium]